MAFEIDFIDALGNPAVAEDLDVRVERIERLPEPRLQQHYHSADRSAAEKETAPALEGESVDSGTAAIGGQGSGGGGEGRSEDRGGAKVSELDQAEIEAADREAFEERMSQVGALRVTLKKANGLEAADLNGKSDPYVVFRCGEHERRSTVKPKTLSPVWNEEFEIEGTLNELLPPGIHVKVFDCDNPLKPEKDESLGEVFVSLDCLKYVDSHEWLESLPTQGKYGDTLDHQIPGTSASWPANTVPIT